LKRIETIVQYHVYHNSCYLFANKYIHTRFQAFVLEMPKKDVDTFIYI